MSLSAIDARALSRFDVVSTTTSLGHPLDALVVGETATIGIRISQGSGVFGLGASVWDYNEAVVDFVSGEAVPAINHASCSTSPVPACVWPFLRMEFSTVLQESRRPGLGNRVLFFYGAGLPATNSNPLDPGLDGVIGGGDAQFRVTFVATGIGSTTLLIGTGSGAITDGEYGSELDTSARTLVPITVVPEPGAGTLVGLGLVGLAASRRSVPRA